MRAALCILLCSLSCYNYSSQAQTVNTPILTAIAREGTGHIITMAAQNVEIGFGGYRLYQASSDSAVRALDALSGVDCSRPLAVLPNQAIPYVIEVKAGLATVSPGYTDRVCAVSLTLVPGTFVAVRALIFRDLFSFDTSLSSNSLLVP